VNEGQIRRQLPTRIRNAAVGCMLISAGVGFFSASEALSLAQVAELKEGHLFRIPTLKDSAEVEKVLIRALRPMRALRAGILSALSVACAFSFVSAGRLLYPRGLSRENMRRLLATSLLIAAVLRTVDGAQWAVVMHRVAKEAAPQILAGAFNNAAGLDPEAKQLMPMIFSAVTVVQTGIVVGAFTLLAHYFRLQRIKEGIATAQDQRE
jgi:hypothetical protein